MDDTTRDALESLNREFYEKHAASFSATRDHAWPGWKRIASRLGSTPCRLLDAGCGNGRFARFLADAGLGKIDYTGVDSSAALLGLAGERLGDWTTRSVRLVELDLLAAPPPAREYDAIVLFGVLHHVPGFARRLELLSRLGSHLATGGFLAATLWRFGADARAAGNTVAFAAHPVRVDLAELEAGDRLLRWRGEEGVVRYCHFVDDEEVRRLLDGTRAAGLRVVDHFRSDGRSGDLNEYLVWSRDDA
jgi:tRNA (uracil-5-)-methyltransferase TRM9